MWLKGADRSPFLPDTWLIITTRGLRSFAYGLLAVVLGVALSRAGLGPTAIGVLITVSLVGDFCGTYAVGMFADQWGRRKTLCALALLMALTGAVFGLTRSYPLLLFAAFFGTLGTSASETAPFLPIEQAMLPQVSASADRTGVFARYNLVASFAGAAGALAASLPDLLTHVRIDLADGVRLMFGLYAAVGLLVAALVLCLSPSVEPSTQTKSSGSTRTSLRQRFAPRLGTSRGIVLRLSALFSVDALAGGLVVQSLMVLYFHLRFGIPLTPLAALFFGANTLSALSFLAAAPLAKRYGLLNTMVFTHLPSNLLLALVAFMPTFPLAAVVLLIRQALSQMDVPTRQAYTMHLVNPDERTAAASVTSLARSAGSSISPIISGALLQGSMLTLGLPFLIAGSLKAAYDLTLWSLFRRVPIEMVSDSSQTGS
jgi:MFS family permease